MRARRAHARDVRSEIRVFDGEVETVNILTRYEMSRDRDVAEVAGTGVERAPSDRFANVTKPSA